MIPLGNDSIVKFLDSKGFQTTLQQETDQVIVVLKINDAEFPLFIRTLTQGPVLQLLVFIPCSLKKETLPDVARLLHLLNKEMDIPGFGMDENAGALFYRITIPSLNNQVDTALLETYLNSIEIICRSFTPVIHNVSQGSMAFDAVLEEAKKAHETDI